MQLFKNESYLHACYVLPHHPKCGRYFIIIHLILLILVLFLYIYITNI